MNMLKLPSKMGFPGSARSKEPVCNVEDSRDTELNP